MQGSVPTMSRNRYTLFACYFGYITQAIINSLLPLLFVTLQNIFHLNVVQIGFMVTYNFIVQILADLFAAKFADRIGYRPCMVAAHVASAVGLSGLAVFPFMLPSPYAGLLVSITIYAIGGGLIEALVGPIVQALPLARKESAINILHSFYCWGHAGVVILTTLFFQFAGTENWRSLCLLWAIIPAGNLILCSICPMYQLGDEAQTIPFRKIFSSKLFWLFVLLMLCAGATEHAMVQWISFFAEESLHITKAVGDLLGPCMFALLMGISRAVYGAHGDHFPLSKALMITGLACIGSYLLAVFSPIPMLSLIGCGICGLAVGLLWPGSFNLCAKHCPNGGTAMFALLAVAGDLGCSAGPSTVSAVAAAFDGQIKAGLLVASIFPLLLVVGVFTLSKARFNEDTSV